jgi:UDP-N-acetylglucosamine 1-carboxyvinyltransferase
VDRFLIEGGQPLRGTLPINGAKNAALPMMAAALLTDEPVTLHAVPDLSDIRTMIRLLEELGVKVTRRGATLRLKVEKNGAYTAPYELVSTMRASFCVLGPLTARRRRARVSLPGGCVIGVRPVDLHLKGLRALGARVATEHGNVEVAAPKLTGARIYLGGAFGSSVTGTANVLMAAVLAEGTTVIESAAVEPEVVALTRMLTGMGARIEGTGTHRLVVRGVKELGGTEQTVIPDRIEAGTFMAAAAVTGGDATFTHVDTEHMTAVLETFEALGVHVERFDHSVRVVSNGMFRPTDLTTLPYPGFPTDLQAQFVAMLTLADGISIVTEKIYPDRFMHVAELGRMGARIRKEGPSIIVHGVPELHGAPVMASDIRASAALVVAALRAKGTTEIQRVYHIDRGYEKIDARLESLGARVQRAREKKSVVLSKTSRWAAFLP